MKYFIKYSALAFVILVSGVLIFLVMLDINHYKPVILKTVSDLTGRELQIAGDLKLTPSLTPVISAQGISLANTPWSSSGNSLLSVGSVEARVSLLPLLTGNIEIKQFILLDTRISLETDPEGAGNWVISAQSNEPVSGTPAEPGSAQMPESVEISEVIIRNAQITYIDGIVGTTTRFAINERIRAACPS
jgi:AsmA protein